MSTKKIADVKPFKHEAEPGFYKWCSCGHSKTQPFCDHSHRTEAPEFKSVKVTLLEKTTVFWCMCKHTKTPPWCDGTHHALTQ